MIDRPRDLAPDAAEDHPPTWALLAIAVLLTCALLALERLGLTPR